MGEWTIHLDMPEGTSLEGTTEVAERLQKELSGVEGVAMLEPAIQQRVTHIHFLGYALPYNQRKVTQDQIVAELRRRLAAYPAYRPSITVRNPLGGGEQGGWPISVNLLGPDLNRLAEQAMRLLAAAQKDKGLTDLRVAVSISNPEIHVAVDRRRAADLGVRVASLGNALRLAVSGEDEISTFRDGAEQYPVTMRVREDQRRDAAAIGRMIVPSATGQQVRVDSIATIERGLGPTELSRSNRQFSINFTADLTPGTPLDQASADVRKMLADLRLPPEMSYRIAGQSKILDETTGNMIMAISLAMIFVYMVLAAQFESFVQPIIIMSVLPLAVPFALFTLWITGRTLNLWSALGMLLLLGIVKKNSILQVDYANILRQRGVPLRQAIVESCRTRLRPILMTTTAIIAGLIPTSLGIGIGGAGRAAIAITIIGGQSLCLFLTLLLVPVAYVKFDALERSFVNRSFRRWLGRFRGVTAERAEGRA
jgi:HAE1 family hydrophobic/amphiphilic exporter-1